MKQRDKELGLQAGYQSVVLLDTYGSDGLSDWELDDLKSLQKFADLIRADQRKACAKTVETIETYEKIEKACFKFAAKTILAMGDT